MLKQFKIAFITMSILLLSACGFQFNNGGLIPTELQTLTLESQDPYDDISIVLRKQLQLHNIKLVEANTNVARLRLNYSHQTEQLASLLRQGKEAEKVLLLEVNASVIFPDQTTFPISTKVSRTFFDNARAAIAKSAEKEVIWNDMREQAVRQLIAKMAALQPQTIK